MRNNVPMLISFRLLMVKIGVLSAASMVLIGCSLLGVRSETKQVAYQVVDRVGSEIEVRRYSPQVVAETAVVVGESRDRRNVAFRRLFRYISGANRVRRKVAMTTPVELQGATSAAVPMTAPVETRGSEDETVMRFFLPAEFTVDTAPQPTDPKVHITELPQRLLAALRFTGSRAPDQIDRHEQDLERAVGRSQWRMTGTPTAMFYDPPWTLPFLRRNEVLVPVARD